MPVTNILDLVNGVGVQSGAAQFGAAIHNHLNNRNMRAMRRNASGDCLIVASPPDNPNSTFNNSTWALYIWKNESGNPVLNQVLPDPNFVTGGEWKGIVSIPDPLVPGSTVRIVADSGDTNYYGTGKTRDLVKGFQKSYSQEFTLN